MFRPACHPQTSISWAITTSRLPQNQPLTSTPHPISSSVLRLPPNETRLLPPQDPFRVNSMWDMVLSLGCILLLLLERPMDIPLCTESRPLAVLRRLLVRVNRLLSRFSTRDNISSMLKLMWCDYHFILFICRRWWFEMMSGYMYLKRAKLLYLS